MVAAGDVAVEEQAVQDRLPAQFDPPLLHQFPPQGFEKGFADLYAAARQVPAGDVTVPDQKHPVVAVEHHAADPERHAAGDPPIEVEDPAQLRLETLSQALQRRHANLGWTAITFDPYIDDMIVRRLYITGNAAERE
jgi:hypothetical protein